eukprot:CAMPEP_0115188378 /NCGR_PEP_ID=MMETSP0270-20121206/10979_1 /TAXON_ID=71861 /ORGANISM="Scrippsiella trochoidea, Strain CCMP3099" /LENGTH=86 /DNA_ID=CAMNT_0002601557 /DNA_START=104 /DNA_END=364 /DNA_ORIENTATION=-
MLMTPQVRERATPGWDIEPGFLDTPVVQPELVGLVQGLVNLRHILAKGPEPGGLPVIILDGLGSFLPGLPPLSVASVVLHWCMLRI